jgi:predicted O-methyltransferase YrrM
MISVMVSLLCRSERDGWINSSLHTAYLSWLMDPRYTIEPRRAYDHHTSLEARNWTAGEFLSSDCDYLLMVDNDTRVDNGHQFLNLPEMALRGYDICAAAVPVLQNGSIYLNGYMEDEDHPGRYRGPDQEEISEALERSEGYLLRHAVGFGAVMIRREVIEKLSRSPVIPQDTAPFLPVCSVRRRCSGAGEAWELVPCISAESGQPEYPVFIRPRDIWGATQLGEDIYFCKRAKLHGFDRIYLSLGHLCGHYHTVDQGLIPSIAVAQKRRPTPRDYHLDHLPELPPITSCSITPDIADYLRARVRSMPSRPRVLEFGSGVSTLVFASLCSAGECGTVRSLEDDDGCRESVSRSLRLCGLSGYARVYPYSCSPPSWPDSWPGDWAWPWKADLVFIDGPRVDSDPFVREHTLHLAMDAQVVAPGALVILDDCNRPGELEVARRWKQRYPGSRLSFERVGSRVLGVLEMPVRPPGSG